ncbi:MAG: Acetyl esterase/lipase [Hydrocarboniphaga sp.]|uniref:alpha/beta hydrolase family protein n=1 Tax=Hydrocarboniphaga sp. TaxID=2033016 RepID=UPI002610A35F|nr:alpha/beta hydrolase [Hydrocarboniphaga sp.]MDB5972358.1 Acetyl esterase/lipase [Hydrocarboniphaga sp.]
MLTWTELSQRPLPPAGERIAYGRDASQFGELRMPAGEGPFAVLMLIHGGCWLSDYDYRYMSHLATAVSAEGHATWTIEYRRLGDSGGGWPQTFLDVGSALDTLRALAPRYRLDLRRVAAAGHSAGGQLALWLAARPRLPEDSAIRGRDPLPLCGAIGLAAITDLAQYRIGPAGSCHASVEPLLGGTPQTVPDRYTQTSPRARLPIGVPQWLVQGRRDAIVSAASMCAYSRAARQAGDTVSERMFDGGHFDAASPQAPAWDAIRGAVNAALR